MWLNKSRHEETFLVMSNAGLVRFGIVLWNFLAGDLTVARFTYQVWMEYPMVDWEGNAYFFAHYVRVGDVEIKVRGMGSGLYGAPIVG